MATKAEIVTVAEQLGRMIAESDFGDFYDVVAGVAAGYGMVHQNDMHLPALVAAFSIRAAADSVTGWRVDDAREEGASWSQIGGALGMSKQSAQQKYGS